MKKTYFLKPTGSPQRVYVDYLLQRLTEFRQAGAKWGQKFGGPLTVAMTARIAQSQLGGGLYDEARFDEVCAHLKEKIDQTILGKRNAARGSRSYHDFSEQFQNKTLADAVPAITQESEMAGKQFQDNEAAGLRAGEPAPLTAASNPRIGGAELTNQPESAEAPASRGTEGECGQETTYQQAVGVITPTANRSMSGDLRSRQSLNQPKDKSDGSGTGSTANDLEAGGSQYGSARKAEQPVCIHDSQEKAATERLLQIEKEEEGRGREREGWYCATDIARATGFGKKRVHRMAERDGWPSRMNRNRLEYQAPERIGELIVGAPEGGSQGTASPTVRFADLSHSDAARQTVLWRKEAVELLGNNVHLGKEMALQLVCNHVRQARPLFHISVSALRRWVDAFAAHGIDGLVEQKRGRVGRKAYALGLATDDLLRAAAAAVEYGTQKKGGGASRLNVARAYRDLVGDPTVSSGPGGRPLWLHGEHASKSYVVPSVRDAIKDLVSPLATKMIQVGPKAARLDGPYSICTYDKVPVGRAFTADDMTANAYVWCEWPNERGWLLIRPQILAAMDVGSMAWLSIRAVMRPKGQYTKDDVWGLIGDVLDGFGLFEIAVLEGGTWRSQVVIGHKTGLDDGARIGGLQSLGVKVVHSRSPRSKIIECAFNNLQSAADRCRGFCGREEMRDRPELVKGQLADCEGGKAHPRQFFMHITEYAEHLKKVMCALNTERNDGQILRGECPADKWLAEKPALAVMPDNAKWMYRASYSVVSVTRNGVRVTQGTGKYQLSYTYANPTALETRRGERVVCYWNDYDPDTDAVVYSIKGGKPDKFICVASRVQGIDRFGAAGEELRADATRKALARNLAVSQTKTLAPYLVRGGKGQPILTEGNEGNEGNSQSPIADGQMADGRTVQVGERIELARAEAAERTEVKRRVRSAVRRVEVDADDQAAATGGRSAPAEEVSAEEIAGLFSSEP